MAKSGNPAKAAQQHTMAEARAAVRKGKGFLVRPFPKTEVLVRSTDEDEAVEVIKALQPAQDVDYDQYLQAILVQMDQHLSLAMFSQEDLVKKWLTNKYETYVNGNGVGDEWMFDD